MRLAKAAKVDSIVATAIREWETRLATLVEGVAPITPPPRVWTAIATRLGLGAATTPSGAELPWWARIATMLRGEGTLTVKAVGAAAVPAGRSLELWMLPKDMPPKSLGATPDSGMGRFALPASPDVVLANVPALAVSLEVAGGSPADAPKGPVLYTGKVERFY